MRGRLLLAALLVGACGARLGGVKAEVEADASSGPDASYVADAANALGAWGVPSAVAGASDPTINQDDVTLNSDLTELYFKKVGTTGGSDLFWMMRSSPADAWGPPTELLVLNSTLAEESPRLSPDNLTLYFGRNGDIYKATRATLTSPWSAPVAVTEVNTAAYEKWMAVCDDDYFLISRAVARTGGATDQDLFVGHLDGTDAGTVSSELSAVGFSEISSFLSTDCKTALFTSNRSGQPKIYMATRSDAGSPFTAPVLYEYFGTATDDEDPWMSSDQRSFYLASIRGGGTLKSIYVSTR
jgi:hypothetical protein